MKFVMKTVIGTAAAASLVLGVAAALPATAATAHPSSSSSSSASSTSAAEKKALAGLYAAAKKAGGDLTVYMGGDAPGQWDGIANAFNAAYPGMHVKIVNDLSKVQDARINNQLATKSLVADIAILQTSQDFTTWKKRGELLKYRPVGASKIFANAKDKDGYYEGVFYGAFADVVNTKILPKDPADFTAADLVKPQFKDKLIFTYPNDDDAVLYDFKLTVDKYGWKWVKKIMQQDPTFLRGTPGSTAGVASGKYLASLGTSGTPSPDASIVIPKNDPFNSWVQRGAIFKNAPHQAAAKLFMSWITSKDAQTTVFRPWTWSIRTDVAPPTGLRALATYKNTNVHGFETFMADRGKVERFRSELQLYVGEVTGTDPADPNNTLGLTPGRF